MDGQIGKPWKWVAIGVAVSAATVGLGYCLFAEKKGRKPKKQSGRTSPDERFVAASELNERSVEEDAVKNANPLEDVSLIPDEERLLKANSAKERGNKYFSGRKFEKAMELYQEAIHYSLPKDSKLSIYYGNRAACHAHLGNWNQVIEDCTSALELSPRYVKALSRRAAAYEKLEMFEKSLQDFTVVCLIEQFQNSSNVDATDRVLKELAGKRVKELFHPTALREELPSTSFIAAYMNSFRYEYIGSDEEAGADAFLGDAKFVSAAQYVKKKKWEKAFQSCKKAFELGLKRYETEALNLRGTFSFLLGDSESARNDFEKSLEIDSKNVNTMIKMACVVMEKRGDNGIEDCMAWFDLAIEANPSDPDIYYHRGQIYFLVQNYDKALADYERSIELDSRFPFAKIQSAVAHYRLGSTEKALQLFDEAKAQFPGSAETIYYYGEILLDQQKVDDALRAFDRAIKLNPNLPLPYLNKGIILFHLKKDLDRAMECTKKAVEVDAKCDLAYVHLAQMYLQQAKLDESIIMYKKAADLARSSTDFENAVIGLEAVRAQIAAVDRLQRSV